MKFSYDEITSILNGPESVYFLPWKLANNFNLAYWFNVIENNKIKNLTARIYIYRLDS